MPAARNIHHCGWVNVLLECAPAGRKYLAALDILGLQVVHRLYSICRFSSVGRATAL